MQMCFFFFNDTATTEIYTLSLHDALPISLLGALLYEETGTRSYLRQANRLIAWADLHSWNRARGLDRKSTRLNSSHANISYAAFCLKKKTNTFVFRIGHHL